MELTKLIAEKLNKTKEEVWAVVETKRKSLDYLISEEGALHIIASELNIITKPEFKIELLKDGLTGVDIFVRVDAVYEKREFERKGKKGKVRNLVVSDSTGTINLSLWDENADLHISEGDIIQITGAYVKKNKGVNELRAGRRAQIDINADDAPPELKTIKTVQKPKTLKDVKEGESIIFEGCLTKVFDRAPFFNSQNGPQLMVSGIVDDGTKSIRAIFFRNAVEPLIGISRNKALEKSEEEILSRVKKFQKFKFSGKIKYNDFTDSNELIINSVHTLDMGEILDKKIQDLIGL